MREVADGVLQLRMGFVNLHVVVTDDGVVLVDTGLPGQAPAVVRALAEARKAVGDITTILVTHQHMDHVGGLAELRRRSDARVVAHTLDVPVITGAEAPALTTVQKLVGLFVKTPEPAPVDEVLTGDGPVPVPGIRAFHTPGHTPGHVSYLLDRGGGVLFAGDAAAGGKVRPTPRAMTDDRVAARASIARLADLDFDVAVFGHGSAVRGRAVERFRDLVRRGAPG
ncbi:MBL fold metallo-hydrolase [Asanoa sp. WMMD1127]|uniref:MBL fold metallo-hydrolase n=1 Tax=Asanoa sp. WMMD1127 TaxID=3016107 RepID=UPI002415FD6D|nr:MBL fold metallo-hydrolase [Asanoa sp. WMMD1127]MDG4826910.1 MBL fold metallo-hydrolase [Asanoa sp. WMMD1127]